MVVTPNRQLLEFSSFFEAVAESISENERGPRPPPEVPVALNAPSLLDSMRILLAEELRAHTNSVESKLELNASALLQLESERKWRTIAEEQVASLESKLELNANALSQLESERNLRALAEEQVASLESKLELNATALTQLESERIWQALAEEQVASLEGKLELNANALSQLESERNGRALAEEQVASLESKLELNENALLQFESERSFRALAEEQVASLESKLELSENALLQFESERNGRALAEEQVAILEGKLELNENARLTVEIELREQAETLALLRSQLSYINEQTQQVEHAHSQLKSEFEQLAVQCQRQQADIDVSRRELDEASCTNDELESKVNTLNARLTQASSAQGLHESEMDSMRVEFDRKLIENESELKRLLLAADELLRDERLRYSDLLAQLSGALSAEQAVTAVLKDDVLRLQAAAEVQATLEGQAQAQAQAEIASAAQAERVRLQTPSDAKKRAPAAFLEAFSSAQPAVIANVEQAPLARLSTAEIEREKHRLAVLSLGTEVAPAKLYFQLLPWQSLKTARISVAANDTGGSVSTLAAFAVATATQQAIDASRTGLSFEQAQVNS